MFERSDSTSLLVTYLSKIEDNRLVTYAEMTDYLGQIVNGQTSSLHSARRICTRDHGQVWLCVRGEGVRLACDQEVAPHHRDRTRKSIRRKAQRAVKECRTVNLDNLDDNEKTAHIATQCHMSLVSELNRESKVKQIESAVNGHQEIPMNKLMKHLTAE